MNGTRKQVYRESWPKESSSLGGWHQEAGLAERKLAAESGISKEDWPQGVVYLKGLAAGSGLPERAGRRERFTWKGWPQGAIYLEGLATGSGLKGWPQGVVYLEGLASGSGLSGRAGLRERFTWKGWPQGAVYRETGYLGGIDAESRLPQEDWHPGSGLPERGLASELEAGLADLLCPGPRSAGESKLVRGVVDSRCHLRTKNVRIFVFKARCAISVGETE
jgi:hypothetical protein